MNYKHTINTSLESNNVNDDDVIELRTLFLFFERCKYIEIFFYKTNYFTTLYCLIVKSVCIFRTKHPLRQAKSKW